MLILINRKNHKKTNKITKSKVKISKKIKNLNIINYLFNYKSKDKNYKIKKNNSNLKNSIYNLKNLYKMFKV